MVHQKYMKGQFQFYFQKELQLEDVRFDKKNFVCNNAHFLRYDIQNRFLAKKYLGRKK